MTNLKDVFHYLRIKIDHAIGKKIILCQSTHLKKVLNCFQMTDYKSISILMKPEVQNLLLFYDNNIVKEINK